MRLVAVGDTHNMHGGVDVPDGDVFTFVGDMSGVGNMDEVEKFAEWLDSLPHERKVIIAGNHDWPFERQPEKARATLPECTYLEDESVTIDGVKFYGSPWQPEFCDWAFNLPRGEALAEKWAEIPEDTDVLLTHGPPKNVMDQVQRRTFTMAGHGTNSVQMDVGCEELLKRVREVDPELHLFGHIHECFGVQFEQGVCFCNCSSAGRGDAPYVFDVELGTDDPIIPVTNL